MHAGIDVGKRKVTLAIGDRSDDIINCHYELKRGDGRNAELCMIRLYVTGVLEYYQVKHVYIEQALVAGARNLQTSLSLAETVGAVLSIGTPATLVPVSSWKKAVIGSGNASKEEVRAWYDKSYPGRPSDNQDVCDSSAIWHYGRLQELEAD